MESPFPEPVPAGTRLIETFGWWPGEGARRFDLHLDRMGRSAGTLGFPFHEDAARERVAGLNGQDALRCRLTLGAGGDMELAAVPLPPGPDRAWRVAIHPERVRSGDVWLAHKTTNRALYDRARTALPNGVDEYLFLNERDELCEGTITNVFAMRQDGRRVTPPLSSGVLPGILREELLSRGEVEEAPITLDMLRNAKAISVGNSLRGEIPAQMVM
ncbi:aminotransferase class IV family protein [Nioella aestuarii]|uniref:aminotransferase class IV family protein n=1 Tax=Nioella aestuarii TaxID=1662864 RepID=UPI003D7F2C5E